MYCYSWRRYPSFLLILLGCLVYACPTVTPPDGMPCRGTAECWGGYFCVDQKCRKDNLTSDASITEPVAKEEILPDSTNKDSSVVQDIPQSIDSDVDCQKSDDGRLCGVDVGPRSPRCCKQVCMLYARYILRVNCPSLS